MTEEQYLIEINFDAIGNVQSSPALAQQVAQRATQRATASGDMLSLFLMAKVMSRGRGGISGASRGTGAGAGQAPAKVSVRATPKSKSSNSPGRITATTNYTSYEKKLEKDLERLEKQLGDEELKSEQLGKKLGDIEANKLKRSFETKNGYAPTKSPKLNESEGALDEVIGPKSLRGNRASSLKTNELSTLNLKNEATTSVVTSQAVSKPITSKAPKSFEEFMANKGSISASEFRKEVGPLTNEGNSGLLTKEQFSELSLNNIIKFNEKLGPPGK